MNSWIKSFFGIIGGLCTVYLSMYAAGTGWTQGASAQQSRSDAFVLGRCLKLLNTKDTDND